MVLKIAFKCVLVCVVILGIVAYVSYIKTGQFWLPLPHMPEISLPGISAAPKMSTLEAPAEAAYKWQINGRWHYGDEPPAGVEAQQINEGAE